MVSSSDFMDGYISEKRLDECHLFVHSALVQAMAEERASEAQGWDIPLHNLFIFSFKATVSQHFCLEFFYQWLSNDSHHNPSSL